jgi:hypothetical protein
MGAIGKFLKILSMNIAIMMLVHKNENQIQRLINHLSSDFDVFVHIDKRSKINIKTRNNVFVFKVYKTYWGSFNQIMATLYLLKEAYKKHYDRYVLISGQDLPLISNNEILKFFENNDYEYINISKIPRNDGWPNLDRLTTYHFDNANISKYNIPLRFQRRFFHILSKIKPRKLNYNFHGGDNWTNYTHNCVEKIFEYLRKEKRYISRYRWTHCADEIFYQTIIANIDSLKIENNCLRYIDWENGPEYPKIFRENDFEKLIISKALFARKFDENIDNNIIDKIYERIGDCT